MVSRCSMEQSKVVLMSCHNNKINMQDDTDSIYSNAEIKH